MLLESSHARLRANAARLLGTTSRPVTLQATLSTQQPYLQAQHATAASRAPLNSREILALVHASFRSLSHAGSIDPDPRVRMVW
jgi:hypothetical protein